MAGILTALKGFPIQFFRKPKPCDRCRDGREEQEADPAPQAET